MTKQGREQRQLKARGLCVSCWNPSRPGKVLCKACARRKNQARKLTPTYRKLHWRPPGRPKTKP